MYGFEILINAKFGANDGDIRYKNITCSNFMIKKFEQDKIFAYTEKYIIMLDGIILNKRELMYHYSLNIWSETIALMYEKEGECFFNNLRGCFCGAIYDKILDKWIIFTDHIGSRFIYYAQEGDFFCCSEIMGRMYSLLKQNNVQYDINVESAFSLLTYGYMLDGRTLCDKIKKINPGCYIVYEKGLLTEKRYYLLKNTPDENIDEDCAVEIVDELFRKAVIRQFEKDKEYGYKHIVALSGGLDCRMTSFVAHDCGYVNQLNLTFSQTDYWDQTIPQKMSSDMKHEWIFKALDNGLWLFDVDEVTNFSGGNVLYYGIAHGNSLIKYLNFESLGLLHSGQIGDVVIGSFIRENQIDSVYELGDKAYSTKYMNYFSPTLHLECNKEIGMFYYRAFNGTNNGLQNIYNYTESLSPFLDFEFLEKMLSIPVRIRQNHNLYKKWIIKKYPQAARYEWESIGCKITTPTFKIGNREIPWRNIPKSIISHINLAFGKLEKSNSLKSMNPISYYLFHNDELRKFLNDYFKYSEQIVDPILRNCIIDIDKSGTSMEKIQAVSLLSAVKLFY